MRIDWTHIEALLRHVTAKMIAAPDDYSREDGQLVDRALRTCPKVTDIDRVWVMWRFVGESRGWLTDKEMTSHKGRYAYPKKNDPV